MPPSASAATALSSNSSAKSSSRCRSSGLSPEASWRTWTARARSSALSPLCGIAGDPNSLYRMRRRSACEPITDASGALTARMS